MNLLPAIFSLLVAVAGWFYLFYSRAAQNLADVELQRINRRRVRLRRIGGLVMLLLAGCFYAGWVMLRYDPPPPGVVLVWMAVLVLLAVILILGLLALRWTLQLKRKRSQP